MTKKLNTLLIILTLSSLAIQLMAQKVEREISIQMDNSGHTISKHIYGHFAEHLGRCIYGGFYVGEDNELIPNKQGVRLDVIQALKDLKVPNLRWPGGCYADIYHWKDGVGPKEDRPEIVNTWWGGVTEDNSFGTHDFLNLCEAIGAEPYLAANVGSGTVREMADWIQYTNHDGQSPMADWRRSNGREKPWNVKYWGVGNESWGCGGNMTPEFYANLYRQYATFMTGWGNTEGLYRVASGSSGTDLRWTEVLMKNVPLNLMEGLSLHWYSVIDWGNKGSSTEFSEEQYFKTMKEAWRMEELVTEHSAIMDKYDPEKRVGLIVDEWGGWYDVEEGTNSGFLYQQNTMRDAMIAGLTLNIFNNHSDRVRMANLAQTVNVLQAVILTNEEKMLLTPTYHIMKMYNVHQDAQYLPVEFENIDFVRNGENIPSLSLSASKDKDGKVHISMVNIDLNNSHSVNINLSDHDFSDISGTILKSDNVQDHNSFEDPEKVIPVEFKDFKSRKGNVRVDLPPFSVVVLEIK